LPIWSVDSQENDKNCCHQITLQHGSADTVVRAINVNFKKMRSKEGRVTEGNKWKGNGKNGEWN